MRRELEGPHEASASGTRGVAANIGAGARLIEVEPRCGAARDRRLRLRSKAAKDAPAFQAAKSGFCHSGCSWMTIRSECILSRSSATAG